MVETLNIEEEICEAVWKFCKAYDFVNKPHSKVLLFNHVTIYLEQHFGSTVENLYRVEWQAEAKLFCEKYGYSE